MKLLLLMSIEEYAGELRKIMHRHRVQVFSETNIVGFRLEEQEIESSWFSGGDRGVYSHLFFSFIGQEHAKELMDAVDRYNRETDNPHPFHGYLLNVEDNI